MRFIYFFFLYVYTLVGTKNITVSPNPVWNYSSRPDRCAAAVVPEPFGSDYKRQYVKTSPPTPRLTRRPWVVVVVKNNNKKIYIVLLFCFTIIHYINNTTILLYACVGEAGEFGSTWTILLFRWIIRRVKRPAGRRKRLKNRRSFFSRIRHPSSQSLESQGL